ncbi:MAG: rod shape-determining protein MreC [Bryobacterales bacterium]|nr:rod shape-determining protein MreC [Bryobacterales bacterium]
MEFVLNRYRNVTVLLVLIAAQLVLLAYQVKSNQDMRLIRVWSVTAITPVAKLVDMVRGGTVGFIKDYFILLSAREENRRLKEELDRLKLQNQFLRTELSTADRAKVLAAFQQRTASRTLGARIIANATGANSKVVFVDRGASSGVQPGMAVVTPDGIIGKVIAVFPTASQVMLVTDPSFAAGVMSEKYRVQGTVKGQGHGTLSVEYVPSELKVEVGEKFYTSGDDRIFPKGFPVGEVKVVRPGRAYKEIFVTPSGFARGLEEVLIVLEGVHQVLPGMQPENVPYRVLPAPGEIAPTESAPEAHSTDADILRERYRKLSESQGVRYGQGGRIPDFNSDPAKRPAPAPGPQGAAPVTPPQPPPLSATPPSQQ